MTGTGDWSAIELEELAGPIGVRIGAWNHFGYAALESGQAAIPPLGERNADAIKAGHGAIEAIDELIRHLHGVRSQLVTELRADEDARAVRVDAMLAEARARREADR